MTAGRGFRHVVNGVDRFRLALECHAGADPITWEPEQYARFMGHVRPGAHVMDLGASVGLFAIGAALRAGPAGRVVAVEPSPRTYRLLCGNVRSNRLERVVRAVPEVCCDRDGGEVDFFVCQASAMVDSAVPHDGPGVRRVPRPATTVDALVRRFDLRPALVKIDVEGFEDLVLRGAGETLARHRPLLFLEFHGDTLRARGVSPAAVVEWLGRHGYRAAGGEWPGDGEPRSGVLYKFEPAR